MKEWKNKKIIGLDDDLSIYSIRRIIAKENANSEASVKAAKKQGLINKKNKFWEKATFEQRSMGGKISGRNRVNDGTLLKASKIGAKISTERRIERAIEKYKSILKFITKKEFTYSDVKHACKEYGIIDSSINCQAKKILKQKSIVKQIHKGYNQFNPSIYIKV
jgi:hypothetical protein